MRWITINIPVWMKITAWLGVAFVVLLVGLHLLASQRETRWRLDHAEGHRRLVVLVHGLPGRAQFESAIVLAREALPDSDFLVFDYDSSMLSNASPYAIANIMERQIHAAHVTHAYREIVLVGHSMGGMLLRKAFVWGNGLEEDRQDFGLRGERDWVHRVSRFVSLATINRGWSIEPRPHNMDFLTYMTIWVGERLARLSQSGQLMLALQRGAPFVADARVQWIALCRGQRPALAKVPQTIHLLGDRDDIVSKDDSMDLIAAKDTIFVTLQDTGHREIGAALHGGGSKADQDRREKVRLALRGELSLLEPDQTATLKEDASVERIVYVMHGIRDYGEWTDRLRGMIEREAATKGARLAVVNQKYGHFPMLPFLLYWDRQKNVRQFMDEYTENRARFPRADTFDYVGHSNGTYILASALQNYATLQVDRVYFAGSVVPKHYPWRDLVDRQRVKRVANVVAAGDWVVALFPRFFEQIADWLGVQPVRGLLDIGSGGFRGFQDAMDAKKRIENVQFAEGAHSTGVDATNEKKLEAIARYIVSGDETEFTIFRNRNFPESWLAFLSNVSWLVWGVLTIVFVVVGLLTFKAHRWAGWVYVVLLLGLLYSV
jgi:pimeloyl-ACP methyl ester carboxylesterase